MALLGRALRGLAAWIDDRTGLGSLLGAAGKLISKPIPRRLSWAYTMGSLALFLFGLQFLTGFLLLAHYSPHAETAYRSVQKIEHHVALGWLVRQMHSWGASFVVIALLVHMIKVLWYGGYKKPREFTWFLGVLLFAVTLGFCFTGYLLPWNQLARWATAVGTDSVTKLPLLGDFLGNLVKGGPTVSGETLGRFFAVHVFILPVVLTALVIAHLALVQKHGISTHLPVPRERAFGYRLALESAGGSEPFFPRQAYRDLLVINLGFALLVAAATFWPWELGPPASDETPEGIKPEWYFLPVYQLLKYFDHDLVGAVPLLGSLGVDPAVFGVFAVNLLGLVFLLLPIIDRGNERRLRKRPLFAGVFLLSVLAIVGLGVLGYLSERTVEIFGTRYHFDIKGFPHAVAETAAAPAPAPAAPPAAAETRPAAAPEEPKPEGSPAAGNAEAPAAGESEPAAARSPPVDPSDPAVAAAGQCGLCHTGKHERPLRDWRLGVHARPPVPASSCVDCHQGDATKQDKDEAHKGILTRKDRRSGKERVTRPKDEQVVEICGRCHIAVKEAFSPDHLGLEPATACSGCHSNHKVLPATLATFDAEKAYKGDDPRAERFLAVRKRVEPLERGWGALERLVERLREREVPEKDLNDDLASAREKRSEARVLTHSLDPDKVERRAAEALKAVKDAEGVLEDRLEDFERRKHLAAAVGTVALLFAALLGAALHRLRRYERRGS